MFSTTTDVPFAVVSILANIDCISVGKPGYGIVFISTALIFLVLFRIISFFSTSILQPHSSNFAIIGLIWFAFTFVNFKFPPVAAPMQRSVPASILSGITV